MPWLLHNLFKYVYKRSVKEYLNKVVFYIVICIFVCVLTWIISNYVTNEGILGMVIKAIIAFGLSNIVQVLIYHNRKEYIQTKELAKKMIKGH